MTSKNNRVEKTLNRRQFLIRTGTTCAFAAGAGGWAYFFSGDEPVRRGSENIYTFKDFRVPQSPLYPSLVIVHGKDAETMTRAAFDKLGGAARFINPGDKVLIKPNVGWDRQPEQAANTNPDVVASVAKLCLEGRASKVWVTDVSINDPYRSFARSGIEASVEKAGGSIKFTRENDFVLTDLKGQMLTVWPVSRFYHDVDKVINVPVVKHHSLSKCTIAMKNWYGVLGGRRNRLHQEINVSIADLATALKPTVTVVDATRVLMRNGPTGGNLSDVSQENTIIAGLDEVALDSYCLSFFNLHVSEVPFLSIAEQRKVGVTNWKSLNYVEITV